MRCLTTLCVSLLLVACGGTESKENAQEPTVTINPVSDDGTDTNTGTSTGTDTNTEGDNAKEPPYCPSAPNGTTGIRICSFVSSPTSLESVTLVNFGPNSLKLTGWRLWDKNARTKQSGWKSLESVSIAKGEKKTIGALPFGINDSGETLTLTDADGNVVQEVSN